MERHVAIVLAIYKLIVAILFFAAGGNYFYSTYKKCESEFYRDKSPWYEMGMLFRTAVNKYRERRINLDCRFIAVGPLNFTYDAKLLRHNVEAICIHFALAVATSNVLPFYFNENITRLRKISSISTYNFVKNNIHW